METYNNFPFATIVRACEQHIKEGSTIYQKFTCSGCGKRLGIDEPNVLYKTGKCEDCGALTNIEEDGCNYLLAHSFGKTGA